MFDSLRNHYPPEYNKAENLRRVVNWTKGFLLGDIEDGFVVKKNSPFLCFVTTNAY